MVVDGLGVAGLAVHQPVGDPAPPGRCLLRRRRDRHQVFDADGANHIGQHPRRRPPELDPVGERFEQLVRIAGVHAVGVQVARDVCAGQTELAGGGGQVGGAAGRPQIQAQLGFFVSGAAAVVRGELEWVLSRRGEDLQDLGHVQLAGGRALGLPGCGHRLCTAFA